MCQHPCLPHPLVSIVKVPQMPGPNPPVSDVQVPEKPGPAACMLWASVGAGQGTAGPVMLMLTRAAPCIAWPPANL